MVTAIPSSPIISFISSARTASASRIRTEDKATSDEAFTRNLAATLLGSVLQPDGQSVKETDRVINSKLEYLRYLDQTNIRSIGTSLRTLETEIEASNLATPTTSKLIDELVAKLEEIALKKESHHRAEFEATKASTSLDGVAPLDPPMFSGLTIDTPTAPTMFSGSAIDSSTPTPPTMFSGSAVDSSTPPTPPPMFGGSSTDPALATPLFSGTP